MESKKKPGATEKIFRQVPRTPAFARNPRPTATPRPTPAVRLKSVRQSWRDGSDDEPIGPEVAGGGGVRPGGQGGRGGRGGRAWRPMQTAGERAGSHRAAPDSLVATRSPGEFGWPRPGPGPGLRRRSDNVAGSRQVVGPDRPDCRRVSGRRRPADSRAPTVAGSHGRSA